MSDLINRQDAIDAVCNAVCECDVPHYPDCGQIKYCDEIQALISLPSADAVEVVRCKDCIHQEHCHETVAHTRHNHDFIEYWSETIEWCSRGERKGGDTE